MDERTLTRQTKQIQRNGRVLVLLEGGYNVAAVANAASSCVRALLGDEIAKKAHTSFATIDSHNSTYHHVSLESFSHAPVARATRTSHSYD